MKRQALMGVAILLLTAGRSVAVPQHDEALERAAMEVVAEKIGPVSENLRGTFGRDDKPGFSTPIARAAPVADPRASAGWTDGLAPAVDPRGTRRR